MLDLPSIVAEQLVVLLVLVVVWLLAAVVVSLYALAVFDVPTIVDQPFPDVAAAADVAIVDVVADGDEAVAAAVVERDVGDCKQAVVQLQVVVEFVLAREQEF